MPIGPLKKLADSFGDDAPDHLLLDGRLVPVSYRRNARARRIIMRMDKQSTGIVLTVPNGVRFRKALDFARSQAGWIWQRLESGTAQSATELLGREITIRGTQYTIEQAEGRGVPVHLCDLPAPMLRVRGEREHWPRRISDFLKREARTDLEQATRGYADAMGVAFKSVTVRDTTTRWGSCSSSGALSYSWRLIMAPPKVLDYVAAHEVAHLIEMNHSKHFWKLVYDHCPHTEFGRKWLRDFGHTLHKLPI